MNAMKEVPKKDQQDVAGGNTREYGNCIPPSEPPFGPDVTIPDDSGPISPN